MDRMEKQPSRRWSKVGQSHKSRGRWGYEVTPNRVQNSITGHHRCLTSSHLRLRQVHNLSSNDFSKLILKKNQFLVYQLWHLHMSISTNNFKLPLKTKTWAEDSKSLAHFLPDMDPSILIVRPNFALKYHFWAKFSLRGGWDRIRAGKQANFG